MTYLFQIGHFNIALIGHYHVAARGALTSALIEDTLKIILSFNLFIKFNSMRIYTFRAIIEPDENNTFHGYVPILKGCHTWGETLEETKKNLKDAIKCYVASIIADGEDVPCESGLEFFETVSEKELKVATK